MPTSEKNWLPTSRVEALSDAVFAIAMTILVLDLVVPDAPNAGVEDTLRTFLGEDWPKLLNYFKGFLLLSVFWVIHHKQFHAIKRTDHAVLWFNILALMMIALVPFTTSVEGEYGNLPLASVIFNVNILAVGLAYAMLWFYATQNRRLVSREDYDDKALKLSRQRVMVMPVLALVAIGLSLVIPSWSSVAYLMIPVVLHEL